MDISGIGAMSDLPSRSSIWTIETNRRRKMEGFQFECRELEGGGTEIGRVVHADVGSWVPSGPCQGWGRGFESLRPLRALGRPCLSASFVGFFDGAASHIVIRCSTRRSTMRRATNLRRSECGMLPK
jgi:hypothetical protein